jgi:hypothetical protein
MDGTESKQMMNMEFLQSNMFQIDRLRTIMAIAGGTCCGALGLTSLHGLLFFLVVTLCTTLALVTKMRFDSKVFTTFTFLNFFIQGISNNAMSFVLFWTLSFALVYIY